MKIKIIVTNHTKNKFLLSFFYHMEESSQYLVSKPHLEKIKRLVSMYETDPVDSVFNVELDLSDQTVDRIFNFIGTLDMYRGKPYNVHFYGKSKADIMQQVAEYKKAKPWVREIGFVRLTDYENVLFIFKR